MEGEDKEFPELGQLCSLCMTVVSSIEMGEFYSSDSIQSLHRLRVIDKQLNVTLELLDLISHPPIFYPITLATLCVAAIFAVFLAALCLNS